jgi:P27 family predicted phage terminase small subunit
VVPAVDHEPPEVIPDPPVELSPPAADAWGRFWRSTVARSVDIDTDLPGLYRWIVAYDEWLRAAIAIRRRRVVRGSTGQPVISPVAAYMAQREAELERANAAFGLSPRTRAALGLMYGEAQLTAAKLNEMTRADDDDNTILAGDWEAA